MKRSIAVMSDTYNDNLRLWVAKTSTFSVTVTVGVAPKDCTATTAAVSQLPTLLDELENFW